jgi:hypothetical protein
VDDTLDFTQLLMLMTVMLGCKKLTALRDMSMATWMTMTLGRGDDARLLFLADLLKPLHIRVIGAELGCHVPQVKEPGLARHLHSAISTIASVAGKKRVSQVWAKPNRIRIQPHHCSPGPCVCQMLAAVLRGGKRQFGGKVAYAGSIRNRLALLCCHGALGRFFVHRFTIRAAMFPNPAQRDVWLHTPMWPGNDPTVSISYSQHAEGLKYYLEKARIYIQKVGLPWGAAYMLPLACLCLHAPAPKAASCALPHRSRTHFACSRHAIWTSRVLTSR